MVTVNLTEEVCGYLVMVLQGRHDAGLQRELHAHSRGDRYYKDKEAELSLAALNALARAPYKDAAPEDITKDPNYCAEHGGHLRDSPACETAKMADLRSRVRP